MTVRTPTRTTPPTSTTRDVQPPTERGELERIGRINRRLLMVLVTAVVGVAVVLGLLLFLDGGPTASRSDAAWTARLDEAAAQYEAVRQTRSNQAWTARLDEAAEQYETVREARALDADAARLTRQADVRGSN